MSEPAASTKGDLDVVPFKGWVRAKDPHHVVFWLTGRRPRMLENCWWRLPADDHASAWKDENGTRYWLSQPYGVRADELKEMMAFAEAYGLKFSLSGNSTWYPGWTLAVIWERA